MIYLYSGTPGSGKSSDAVRFIKKYLYKRDGLVISNFSFARPLPWGTKADVVEVDNVALTPALVVRKVMPKIRGKVVKENQYLIVIDEAQLKFNNRDWNDSERAAWISFFTQHRKLGFDVLLICQFPGMLDKQIRPLIEYEVVHRKFASFGLVSKIIAALTFNRLYARVIYYMPTKTRISGGCYFLTPGMCKFYDSHALFSGQELFDEFGEVENGEN